MLRRTFLQMLGGLALVLGIPSTRARAEIITALPVTSADWDSASLELRHSVGPDGAGFTFRVVTEDGRVLQDWQPAAPGVSVPPEVNPTTIAIDWGNLPDIVGLPRGWTPEG